MAQIGLKAGWPGVENPTMRASSLALFTPSTLRALGTNEVDHLDFVWTLNSEP